MKYIRKFLLSFLLFFSSILVYAQCNIEQTIEKCAIQDIDFNNDGDPDGIINLYDEYTNITGGDILEIGEWTVNPRFQVALDKATGNVSLWDLQFATEEDNLGDYIFELVNSTCGTDIAATIVLILGPYSGVALPSFGINNINIEVCGAETNDLFETLVSDSRNPPPHLNGKWIYNGSSPHFLGFDSENPSFFSIEIPYQPGIPLVDQEVFEFDYVVSGSAECGTTMTTNAVTTVRVSVVRQVNAGNSEETPICESEILAGAYDTDINLRDDVYLKDEDEEGRWRADLDTTGEIESVLDSSVNIKRIYDEIIRTKGPRFGFSNVEFSYSVDQRSGVCADNTAKILFTIFEALRPFKQNTENNNFCLNDDSIRLIDLFDLIEFTTASGEDFIYDNLSVNTVWSQVSGPESIDIEPEFGVPGIVDIRRKRVSGKGPRSFILPGTYVFKYRVSPWVNSPDIIAACLDDTTEREATCSNPCDIMSAEITINILGFEFAGLDGNEDLEFCETDDPVNLRSFLKASEEGDTVATSGIWTDAEGNTLSNVFVFSEIDADQELKLTYTTTHPTDGCIDTSILEFKIKNRVALGDAGESVVIDVCTNDKNIILFNQLDGFPDPIGMWTGPDGYVSADHLGQFIFNDTRIPRLQEGVYTYTIGSNDDCSLLTQATVTINFVEPIVLNVPIMKFFCKKDGAIDLLTLLDAKIPTDGRFIDVDSTGALSGAILNVDILAGGFYNFKYVFDNSPCDSPVQDLVIEIIDDENPPSAGESPKDPIRVCSNDLTINLFDQLAGRPSMSGRWNGPFSYESDTFLGEFDQGNIELPILGPGVYTYTIGGRGECGIPTIERSRVIVEIIDPIDIGENVNASFCKLDGRVNLFTLLDVDTTRTGEFIDTDSTNALDAEGNLEFSSLGTGIYNFQYAVTNAAPCEISMLNVEIDLVALPKPVVTDQVFCILDAKRLEDIPVKTINADGNEVDLLNFNWYSTLESDQKIENNPKLIDSDVFYIANSGVEINDQECESERVQVSVRILNVGESSETGLLICPLDFQDGVSPNGDRLNDTFELVRNGDISEGKQFNIPQAFPNFNLEIYNRYGVKVFEANIDTPEFKGKNNQSLSIGDDLPSGVYFYIFNPNFKNNFPIQGSFYLSK